MNGSIDEFRYAMRRTLGYSACHCANCKPRSSRKKNKRVLWMKPARTAMKRDLREQMMEAA